VLGGALLLGAVLLLYLARASLRKRRGSAP
jgi:hypothetical protein